MGKIILTGVTGFIGRNFLEYIEKSKLIDKSKLILISSVNITGYFCVNRNNSEWQSQLNQALEGESADVVFHLGSYTPKSGLEANNIEGSFSNIEFTKKLIDSITPPKCFVFTSTLDIYDFKEVVNENSIPNASSLYAWSKIYCEEMLAVWAKLSDVKLQVIRVGHVYGEGEESYKKLIPVTIEACLNGKNPELHTSGTELRSFIYISDLCRIVYDCSSFTQSIGVVNVVGNEPISVKNVVETIIELINPTLNYKIKNKAPGLSTRFSNSKMIEIFGDRFTPFKLGIQNEINYFKMIKSL